VAFPNGMDAVKAEYGDPRPFLRSDGTITSAWETTTLAYLQLPGGLAIGWDPTMVIHRIRCHRKLTGSLGAVFQALFDAGHWELLKSFDGCYSWRTQRGSQQKLSMHCWGVAIDLNAASNVLGTNGDMPDEVIQAFQKEGWEWGGKWHRPDPQHFQAAWGV
jgi:hypothetical protein